jgi:uncharacterized protein
MESNGAIAEYPPLPDHELEVINKIETFTEAYFQDPRFDASHDFAHVRRVLSNALQILRQEQLDRERHNLPPLNALSVILAAFLHDVEDKKYTDTSAINNERPVRRAVKDTGLSETYAQQIQVLVENVSYSSEVKCPEGVRKLIESMPELAVVQDADRLDAIGAVGIARCFTFGGAKGARSLQSSVDHFNEKLLKLEGMMKTPTGREMARKRSSRIREFMSWWIEEVGYL